MRINNNIMAMNTHRQLGMTTGASAKSMEKLSSGFRINRAGDDAAGLAISEKMRGQIRGLNQASRNSQDSISLIQTAEGALNETHAILQRMRELAVQSANGTAQDSDRAKLNDEFKELITEVSRIGKETQFNEKTILGKDFAMTAQVGANKGQTMVMSWKMQTAQSLGENDVNINAQTVSAQGKAASAIIIINSAIESVSKSRSKMGAYQNRLEHTIKNLDNASENLQASESRIRDVDMAKEMMQFSKNNILQQAAQAMLAQANQAPQGVLQLLR